jgi:hypothetical protein
MRRVSRRGVAGGGIGAVVLALIALFFGFDPTIFFQDMSTTAVAPSASRQTSPLPEDELADFVSVVLADTEDTWGELFQQAGQRYQAPNLVLFSGSANSACGFADAAVGPFYCPGDQKVYLDLEFLGDLKYRFGAPGDFAQAYVIAHEVGHHVQTLLGITQQVSAQRQRSGKRQSNQLSVLLELQADCLAGVWANRAHRSRQILERGDVEEGLGAASAVGDDRIQRKARGHVTPDSFTHGSSAQRVEWFKRGLAAGEFQACNTFGNSARF